MEGWGQWERDTVTEPGHRLGPPLPLTEATATSRNRLRHHRRCLGLQVLGLQAPAIIPASPACLVTTLRLFLLLMNNV